MPGPYRHRKCGIDPARRACSPTFGRRHGSSLEILGAWPDTTAGLGRRTQTLAGSLQQALADAPEDRWPNAQVLLQRLRSGPGHRPRRPRGLSAQRRTRRPWVVRSGEVRRHRRRLPGARHGARAGLCREVPPHKHREADEIDVSEEYKRVEKVPPHRECRVTDLPCMTLSSYKRDEPSTKCTRASSSPFGSRASRCSTRLSSSDFHLARAVESRTGSPRRSSTCTATV